MSLWFGPDERSVVGFVDRAGVRVVAGAPVCPEPDLGLAVAQFEADAYEQGARVCWFAAEARLEELFRGRRALTMLGAQPVWDPQEWRGRVHSVASLRGQFARARNKGVRVNEWRAPRAYREPGLRECLAQWLAGRGLPPLHFLIESDTLGNLEDRRIFVARRDSRIEGFAVASPVPARHGWLLEQLVRRPEAPNGTAELLVDYSVSELAESGASYLTLGLAPLARPATDHPPTEPWWIRTVLAWARAHGRRFYDFNGLLFFKSKFRPPRWEPIYLVDSGSKPSPRTLYAVASAFSDGPPLTMLSRAMLRALREEFSGARRSWLAHGRA